MYCATNFRIFLALTFAVSACSKDPQPTQPTQLPLVSDVPGIDARPARKVSSSSRRPNNSNDVPIVSGLSETVEWNKVTLTWNELTGEDFKNYLVYRNPPTLSNNPNADSDGYVLFGVTDSESYSDGSVITGNTYQYRIYVNYHTAEPNYSLCDAHILDGRVDDWFECLEEQDNNTPTHDPSRYAQTSEITIPEPTPTPPQNLRIVRADPGYIEIAWDRPEGAKGDRNVIKKYWQNPDHVPCSSGPVAAHCPEKTINPIGRTWQDRRVLGGTTVYTVSNAVKWTDQKATIEVATNEAPAPTINRPSGVEVSAKTTHDVDRGTAGSQPGAIVSVRWSTGKVPAYIVQYQESGGQWTEGKIKQSTGWPDKYGLDGNDPYEFPQTSDSESYPCGFNTTYRVRVGTCEEVDCSGNILWAGERSVSAGSNRYPHLDDCQ